MCKVKYVIDLHLSTSCELENEFNKIFNYAVKEKSGRRSKSIIICVKNGLKNKPIY